MQSFLKTEKYECQSLKMTLELRELSARDQADIIDARAAGKSATDIASLTAQRGVIAWAEETPETVGASLSQSAMLEIASRVIEISGTEDLDDPKNLEADQGAASSSDSLLRSA